MADHAGHMHHHVHPSQVPTTAEAHIHGGHDTQAYNVVTEANIHDHIGDMTHGAGSHGAAGSGSHAGHHSGHHLSYFHNSLNATALFENWILDTNGSIFLACLCTLVLAMGYQGIKWLRQYLHINYGDKIHAIKSKEHVLQTVLYVTEFIVSYLLMLLVMTYNIWVFIVTVLGITVGYFLLAWHKAFKLPGTCSNSDCPNVNVIDKKNKDYDKNHSSQELMPLENGAKTGACGIGIEDIAEEEDSD